MVFAEGGRLLRPDAAPARRRPHRRDRRPGSAEFLTAFGDPFPARNFAAVIGLPPSDVPFFIECSNRISGSVNVVDADPVGAMNDIKAYFAVHLAERRKNPRDENTDFLTLLMNTDIDGRPLDDEEFLDICMTLTFGSLDTTKSVLAAPLASGRPSRRPGVGCQGSGA